MPAGERRRTGGEAPVEGSRMGTAADIRPSPSPYDRLAALVSYPGPEIFEEARSLAADLAATEPGAADRLSRFAKEIRPLGPEGLEELYTRTFDLNPACSLETGWHLYGENYARGTFLVEMRQAMRSFHVEETAELPDHLCHTLRILGRMRTAEARAFAGEKLLVALGKIQEGLRNASNPYEHLLEAVVLFVKGRHGGNHA